MNERDLGWLEGIIDGEGYLGMWKAKSPFAKRGFTYMCQLTIANTNKDAIEKSKRLLDGGSIGFSRKDDPRWKDTWHLVAHADVLRRVLPELRLTVKDAQRRLVLEALSLISAHTNRHTPNDSRLEEIYNELRILNKRGK